MTLPSDPKFVANPVGENSAGKQREEIGMCTIEAYLSPFTTLVREN